MGRQKLRNHFGTAAVLGRSQFVLKRASLHLIVSTGESTRCLILLVKETSLWSGSQSNLDAAIDVESGICCWHHSSSYDYTTIHDYL